MGLIVVVHVQADHVVSIDTGEDGIWMVAGKGSDVYSAATVTAQEEVHVLYRDLPCRHRLPLDTIRLCVHNIPAFTCIHQGDRLWAETINFLLFIWNNLENNF